MKRIVIHDRIYGTVELDSPLVFELTHSPSLQRLKKICQFGIPDEFYIKQNYYRFEHSVGVMILLRKLGASEEEQIAGLLHDISHTAFSHVVDWVIGEGGNEDYQDNVHLDMLRKSDIPALLSSHGYNVEKLADLHHYHLLDRDMPDLCVDRLDYSFREFEPEIAAQTLTSIRVVDNMIVFNDSDSAYHYAYRYLRQNQEHWTGFEATTRYRIFADVLRRALDLKVIMFGDLWIHDEHVVNKLKQSTDKEIQRMLALLRHKSLEFLPKSKRVAHKKFRWVDPLILVGNVTKRLSEISKTYCHDLEASREQNKKGITLPVYS
ncbi:HD domain-containing protein [Candidatus Roizmanbacteria bacterium]|nr:HD domain-containing protein [Candidatus Roizmanbacteria bacterium]